MRILAGVLGALILAIQYPALAGQGRLAARLGRRPPGGRAARSQNERLEVRNGALAAEVKDLKQGFDAIEERARYELGMVKNDEVFFQVPGP